MLMLKKFSCLILCAMAVAINSVSAEGSCREAFKPLEQECIKEIGVSEADVDAALGSGDVTLVNPCYWGCYFKKLGVLNDKGQYDVNNGLAGFKKYTKTDEAYSKLEDATKKCETVQDAAVNDGEAGCERGALVAACLMKYTRPAK